MLHTQTTTWLAAKLYLDAVFEPLNIDEKTGWRILKTLTNHDKLSDFERINDEAIYDKRNIKIEKHYMTFIKQMISTILYGIRMVYIMYMYGAMVYLKNMNIMKIITKLD